MATPTLDERLDVVEQRLTAFRVECHQTLAPIRMELGRGISRLEAGIDFILNKLSILERVEQNINPLAEWSTRDDGSSQMTIDRARDEEPLNVWVPREASDDAGSSCAVARISHLDSHDANREALQDLGMGLREKRESLCLLERCQEHEDLGSFLSHSRGTAWLLLQPLDGVGSQPLELGYSRGSSPAFDRTGIGQEHGQCTVRFDDGEGLSSRRGAGFGRQDPTCKDFGPTGFGYAMERLGQRGLTETWGSRDATMGVTALELRGDEISRQPGQAGAMGLPAGFLGICILQGSYDGCCCRGNLGMEVFSQEELVHRGGGGFFELGLTGEFGSGLVRHEKQMDEHKKWDFGLVHTGSNLSPTPGMNHVSIYSSGPTNVLVSFYSHIPTSQLPSIHYIGTAEAKPGRQQSFSPLKRITTSENQITDESMQYFRLEEGRMAFRQWQGNAQFFWRTGIGQAQGIGTASSHFCSTVVGNRSLSMTARYENPGSLPLFYRLSCRADNFAIVSGLVLIAKSHDANEVTTMIIGYMEFGKLEIVGKLFQVMLLHYVVTETPKISNSVESFQPREEVQHLWARFRPGIEPVPLIWSRVPLEISSTVFADWGAMISGDAKFVAGYRVLHRFHEIICRGTTLNWFYFWEVFSACNNPRLVVLIEKYVDLMLGDFTLFSFLAVVIFLVAMDHGNWAHSYHNRRGHEWDMVIGTAMINIYNPCERADQAHKVFEEMPRSNTLTSTTLISLLTIHGLRTEAKDVFGQMEIFGVESIFVTVVLACSQAVLGGNGRWRFDMNRHNHSRELPVYYHICLVDILDRVGLIEVTEKVLEDMLLRCVPLWVATLSPIPSMLQHHSGVLVWLSNLPLRQARNCVMTLQLDAAAVRVPPYHPMSKGWPPPNFHLEDKVFFGGRVLIGFHTFSNEMLS